MLKGLKFNQLARAYINSFSGNILSFTISESKSIFCNSTFKCGKLRRFSKSTNKEVIFRFNPILVGRGGDLLPLRVSQIFLKHFYYYIRGTKSNRELKRIDKQWEPYNCAIWRRHWNNVFDVVTQKIVLLITYLITY